MRRDLRLRRRLYRQRSRSEGCSRGCQPKLLRQALAAADASTLGAVGASIWDTRATSPRATARVPPIKKKLSLRELETLARAGLARFLALFHARIATKKPVGFQRGAEVRVGLQKGA
jgi:hypothetical protein